MLNTSPDGAVKSIHKINLARVRTTPPFESCPAQICCVALGLSFSEFFLPGLAEDQKATSVVLSQSSSYRASDPLVKREWLAGDGQPDAHYVLATTAYRWGGQMAHCPISNSVLDKPCTAPGTDQVKPEKRKTMNVLKTGKAVLCPKAQTKQPARRLHDDNQVRGSMPKTYPPNALEMWTRCCQSHELCHGYWARGRYFVR